MFPHLLTVDVEDWFNILDTPAAPPLTCWENLESRLEPNLYRLLELFEKHHIRVTFFWIGWFAEHYPALVKACVAAGHEIASHSYSHCLAYEVGQKKYFEDIVKAKKILEDVSGQPVRGFRAAGFSALDDTDWFFDCIAEAGYWYDSSIFPASRGHGGMKSSPLAPYRVQTEHGSVLEIPQSMLQIFGHRISVFGGGYLRLAPWPIIHWGVQKLEKANRPLVVYVHPREIDPPHPRLALPLKRRFKCYINLRSTYNKLDRLCKLGRYVRMIDYFQGLQP